MALLKRKTPEDRFADEVASVAKAVLGASVTRRKDFALDITMPGRSSVTMFLDNVYHEAQGTPPGERAARVRTAVMAMNAPDRPQTWDEARSQLLPAVRAVSWAAAAGDATVRRPFLPLIETLVAIDSEFAMTYVNNDDLGRWGVDAATVDEEARANLSGHAIPHERWGSGLVITGPDGYASSWLTQPGRLVALAKDIPPPVVLFAPSRDMVVLASGVDPAIEKVQQDMISAHKDAVRGLSPCPYLLDERAELSPWQPPVGSASAALASRAARILEYIEHQEQTARIEQQFEAAGEDTYAGAYGLVEGPDDTLWSYTTWAKGVSSGLLPRADYVALIDADAGTPPLMVEWDDVIKHASGSLTARAGLNPPRWHYAGWPSAAAMQKLEQCRTEPPRSR